MLYNDPSPLEVKVLTRRFGLPNSASIDTYLANDGYKGLEKARTMKPEEIIEEIEFEAWISGFMPWLYELIRRFRTPTLDKGAP